VAILNKLHSSRSSVFAAHNLATANKEPVFCCVCNREFVRGCVVASELKNDEDFVYDHDYNDNRKESRFECSEMKYSDKCYDSMRECAFNDLKCTCYNRNSDECIVNDVNNNVHSCNACEFCLKFNDNDNENYICLPKDWDAICDKLKLDINNNFCNKNIECECVDDCYCDMSYVHETILNELDYSYRYVSNKSRNEANCKVSCNEDKNEGRKLNVNKRNSEAKYEICNVETKDQGLPLISQVSTFSGTKNEDIYDWL
jgi:hypothetical protein